MLDAHADLGLIDYRVGPKDALMHRISARVIAGPNVGLSEGQCLVMLMAWRPAGMAESRSMLVNTFGHCSVSNGIAFVVA